MTNRAPNGVMTGLWSSTAPWKTSSVLPAGSSNVITSSTRRSSASAADSSLNDDTSGVQVGFDFRERGVVAHFPADRQNPVDVAGDNDDARCPLIHPQVQG